MNRLTKQALSLLRKARCTETLPKMLILVERACALMAPPKKSDKARAFKGALRARKSTKIAAHRMSTKEIRAFDIERAGGFCECGCKRAFDGTWWNVPELDEWLGGSGRKQQKKSVKNTWILVRWCHRDRTRNWPGTVFWNEKWRSHCARHNYPFTPHVEHAPLPKRAG